MENLKRNLDIVDLQKCIQIMRLSARQRPQCRMILIEFRTDSLEKPRSGIVQKTQTKNLFHVGLTPAEMYTFRPFYYFVELEKCATQSSGI